MSSTAFNALAAARELEAAGIERRHADAIAAVTHRAAAADREIQATKADIAGLDARIAGLEARIYRALWIQGTGIVAIVGGFIAIAAALRLFGAWRAFEIGGDRTAPHPEEIRNEAGLRLSASHGRSERPHRRTASGAPEGARRLQPLHGR